MSSEGGSKAVLAALSANLGIAVAKFVGFALTGSSSMLAEAVHSVADSGNQLLLLVGGRTSRRAATAEHPFGYGRDRYVYGFLVALVLFSLGGLFATYEGIHKIANPHHVDDPAIAIVILALAIVLEGWSFRTAIGEAQHTKGSANWLQFVRRAKAPELPVVLLEDFAALIGLVLALLGVSLAAVLDQPVWDGIGTLSIGILLLAVAVVLIVETKSLLLGESASAETQTAVAAALLGDGVERVIHLRTLHLGPEELLVAAKIALAPEASLAEVARAIDAAEVRVRASTPAARVIYLEPDLDRTPVPTGILDAADVPSLEEGA
jgi:cation diffusion facilitator family transporter